MPSYDIQDWNPVIPKCATFPFPMIYIKADPEVIQYAKENANTFKVKITGTDTGYDNVPLVGITEDPMYFPSYRPNFAEKTGYYAIVLLSKWWGYPPNKGNVLIQGLVGPDKLSINPAPDFVAPAPLLPGKLAVETQEGYALAPSVASSRLSSGLNMKDGVKIMIILIAIAIAIGMSYRK